MASSKLLKSFTWKSGKEQSINHVDFFEQFYLIFKKADSWWKLEHIELGLMAENFKLSFLAIAYEEWTEL